MAADMNNESTNEPQATPEVPAASQPPVKMTMPIETMPKERASLLFPILGILLVVLMLILGGLYLWGAMLAEAPEDTDGDTMDTSMDTQATDTQTESLEQLEAELSGESYSTFESDMQSIEAELEAESASQ